MVENCNIVINPDFEKRLILKNKIEDINTLHDFIDNTGEELNLSPELVMSLNLAMEEAVSNVILYAYPQGEKSCEIYVDCIKSGDKISFVITDSGIPFDPTVKDDPDITLPASERPIGGLGIFLVRQIMTEISYKRYGDLNVLTLTKNISKKNFI